MFSGKALQLFGENIARDIPNPYLCLKSSLPPRRRNAAGSRTSPAGKRKKSKSLKNTTL